MARTVTPRVMSASLGRAKASDARTQGAPVTVATGATEDAAARRLAAAGGRRTLLEDSLNRLACGLRQQVLVDEAVEVAVEHALGAPDLVARTEVLDLLVRVQHIAADLAPEADV